MPSALVPDDNTVTDSELAELGFSFLQLSWKIEIPITIPHRIQFCQPILFNYSLLDAINFSIPLFSFAIFANSNSSGLANFLSHSITFGIIR